MSISNICIIYKKNLKNPIVFIKKKIKKKKYYVANKYYFNNTIQNANSWI